LPGCANRLGPVRATQSGGSTGHANLPDIVVERSKECVELYGQQLAPGRVVVESTVEVNEDGDKVGVNLGGLPENAPDFGACLRNALHDMPIVDRSLHDAVKTLKFNRKHAGDSHYALVNFINVVPGVPIVESELVLEADGYTVVLPVTVKVVAQLEELIDIDEAALKKAGQMALDSLGYDEILRRAKQVGWVKSVRKVQPKAPARKGLIAQSETEVVIVMFEVFTEYAVTAGVVSQVDSPLPGPADLAAIGILAFGLCKVGAVAIDALSTATAPAPTSRPPPPPAPPPPPPQDPPRREKPDKCPKIKVEIHDLIYTVRPPTTGDFPTGYQGLAMRWVEFAENRGNWGPKPDGSMGNKAKNHLAEYQVHQKRLVKKLDQWYEEKCTAKGHTLPDNAGQYAIQEPQLGPGKPLKPAPTPTY